jgi:hypothetical protein
MGPKKVIYKEGDKVGVSTLIREIDPEDRMRHWVVKCFCGEPYQTSIYKLKSGENKGCGCQNRIQYLPGQKINECIVIKELQPKGYSRYFLFQCHCGKEFANHMNLIKGGRVKGCGCLEKKFHIGQIPYNLGKSNPNIKKYKKDCWNSRLPEYRTWISIKQRCYNSNHSRYYRYGMRGIKVCDRWLHSFENFFIDMGERGNKKLSIERRNNDGDYEPNNCYWGTSAEQSINKSSNRFLELWGEIKTISQWSKIASISENTIRSRLKYGWDANRILTEPLRHIPSKISHSFGIINA